MSVEERVLGKLDSDDYAEWLKSEHNLSDEETEEIKNDGGHILGFIDYEEQRYVIQRTIQEMNKRIDEDRSEIFSRVDWGNHCSSDTVYMSQEDLVQIFNDIDNKRELKGYDLKRQLDFKEELKSLKDIK